MRAWKLIIGAMVTVVMIGFSPYLFQSLGWVSQLNDGAWIVLLVTGFGLLLKLYVADRASDGEFLFYKFGYDNCIVAFGAVLTAFSLQLQSSVDLFPGLSAVAPFNALQLQSGLAARNLQLFFLLLAALFASLFTAHISGEIKRGKQPDRGFWPLVNSMMGCAMLAIYVLVLITKG
jgi:hypothetical protein